MGGDQNGSTGRVEVARNRSGPWGSVCDDLWTEREAQVVCRNLNYQWGTAHSNSPFGEGSGSIFLDNVQCTGTESSLSECQHNGWGVHNCRHYEDAGVSCYNNSVRLKSRGVTNLGTVEIRTDAGWVQVCDDDWDREDALVVCREQNFNNGIALTGSKLGKISTHDSMPNVAFSRFHCNGNERSLLQCPHQNLTERCSNMKRASAICFNGPMNKNFDIRFVKTTNSSANTVWGEISVRRNGVWGQVCGSSTDWNDVAANVACRQMGFTGGVAYGTVNETLRPIWITKLNCTGNETSLDQCVKDKDSWGHPVHSCRPAYALCYRHSITADLVDGGSYYGRVQITYDGATGTVCDDSWSSSDARVLCKSKGYADGEPISNSYYGKGSGHIMMNGLSCYGYESSIFQCRNDGWMTYKGSECSNHTKDASVICYKDVRLSRGDHSHGVVQIMDQYWSVLCGEGFTDTDAKVICRELGFQYGRNLPKGTFGTFYGRYSRPNITCHGNESTILDCKYDELRSCQRENYLGYAAVSCYNGTLNKTLKLRLENGAFGYENQTGRVAVMKYGIWGRICPSAWDDKDADVVCRQLHYTGGVAYQETSSGSGPYFLGEVNCKGSESHLFNCSIGVEECDSQYSLGSAGVLCYRQQKPQLRLVGGAHNTGRLEIIMDDEVGTICDQGWSRYDATVACRQLGFTGGEFKRGLPGPNVTKFLSSMNCFGSESSIFMCRNPGWKQNIPSDCYEPNRNAGVFCYNNVRISSGQTEDNATTGQVEMYKDGNWVTVCADGFDENDAQVVCRELGFGNSKTLVPGAFGSKYYTNSILNLNCTGTEATVKECKFEEGTCAQRSYNYASVICSKYSMAREKVDLLPRSEFPDTLLVEKFGIQGTICAENWDDNAAGVACRQLGYTGGVPFGPRYYSSRTPIWLSSVNCTGKERNINDCTKAVAPVSQTCLSSRLAARVFCYNGNGFNIRLAGTDNTYSGRVEISYNGVWGTICDSYWNNNDARVVCRQLGFVDGVAQPRGKYGGGEGPSWLYYVRCDGNEKSIWECSNSGWNVTHTSCRTHEYDAGVYCTGQVRLEPNITFGAVELWQDTQYALVCADGFDDSDAKVVCHSLGYRNGISICCSVFGDMPDYQISINNVQCTGHESSILQCEYTNNADGCLSKRYASVACSNAASSGAYELRLSEDNKGVVQVRHLNVWGSICSDGFDNKDAKVVCRELGYQDGFSYYEHDFTRRRLSLPWLSNLNCTGNEGYIARCGNIRWGNVGNCSQDTKAAVYCLENANIPIRLINGSNNSSGRVELSINNQWGTICGSGFWDDEDATVLCRMLNHTSGRALGYGQFGAGDGPIWIAYLRCQGDEESIFNCPMSFNEQRSTLSGMFIPRGGNRHMCFSHNSDAAVQCYDSVRLVDSKDVFYGRLEMYINKTFTSVCDEGFTDRSAKVACNILGFPYGKKQCCSALGPHPTSQITVTNVQCRGSERSLDQCPHQTTTKVPCRSGKYASVYCSKNQIVSKELQVKIREEEKYYGSVEANEYGFWSPVCNVDWDDHDANVTCRQMNFYGGVAFRGSSRLTTPISVGRFNCSGTEQTLKDCPHKKFEEDLGCSEKIEGRFTRTSAGVLCYQDPNGVKFRIAGDGKSGVVEVLFNGKWGRVCNRRWDDRDARVFCRSLGRGFIDGEVGPDPTTSGTEYVWIDYLDCEGDEQGLLQCSLHWDPDYSQCKDASVICMDNVRLDKGDKRSHGVVQVYMEDHWGTVCGHLWSEADIRVTCRQLGYEHGLSVCCGAYGYSYDTGIIDKVNCSGNEKSLLNCTAAPPVAACHQDYAAVACYNGQLPSKTEYTLGIAGSSNNSGSLELTYMNISGRICADDWDEKDATVACRQMGYVKGLPYKHKILFAKGTPIWATKVNCTGSEYKLSQCPNFTLGHVDDCIERYDAGVVCYSTVGVNFRLTGGTSYYGRVEMAVDGLWGTICKRFWDDPEASAFCRSLGFNTGFPYHKNADLRADDHVPIYEPNMHCKGKENSLLDCPHEGWKRNFSKTCELHDMDATVHCYNTIKLDTGIGVETKHGPVMFYYNDTWSLICDRDFDDMSARVVCRELGFVEGKAICCSAYGKTFDSILKGKSLKCSRSESSISECLKDSQCDQYDTYASVMCFTPEDLRNETMMSGKLTFGFVSPDNPDDAPSSLSSMGGVVAVSQFNVTGRISSRHWDDKEAAIFCRSLGARYGLAYQTSSNPIRSDPVFLVSDFNCTGSEASLQECKFHDRLTLGNSTMANAAAALCYNESGINYTLANGGKNYGRVELAFNNQWGTICDLSWDDKDAGVFCRMMNFSDGYAISGAQYGEGKGPVWLSHLVCNGDEKSIHSCAHRGFSEEVVTTGWKKCTSHKDDAGVFCVNKLRLNLGYNASMGAVEIYHDDQWMAVCDDGFNGLAARVVCQTLGYKEGVVVLGSAFGETTGPIRVRRIDCGGNEKDLFNCNFEFTDKPVCKKYISVYCSNVQIYNTGFNLTLDRDDVHSDTHGEVMINMNGIWGSICMNGWSRKEATVVCKGLGFRGGVPYQVPSNSNYKRPILMSDVQCTGTETSLAQCKYTEWYQGSKCLYKDNRAGVLCYTQPNGLQYRLRNSSHADRGRVEIVYDGKTGGICNFLWDSRDASVFCRDLGYADGIEIEGGQFGNPDDMLWFTRVGCLGEEDELMKCDHSGFNSSGKVESTYERLCRRRTRDAAAWCFREKVEITNVRLAGSVSGATNMGRVEVFVTGPNEWGTVCDDYWDDRDATVVCRSLGYETGVMKKHGVFGRGSGPIWLDNVDCAGTENGIKECRHNGINIQNCNHGEDAGVVCSGLRKSAESSQAAGGDENSVVIAVTVPIILLLFSILVILGGCYWYQRLKQDDGMKSVLVESEMTDTNETTLSSTSASESTARVTLSKLRATFSKSKENKGLGNPNYNGFEAHNPGESTS